MKPDEDMPAFFDEGDPEKDEEALEKVDTDLVKTLSALCRDLRHEDRIIADLEEELADTKRRRHRLASQDIPALFSQMGIEEIKVDGAKVTLKPVISASIPKDRKDEAFAWLRQRGYDGIIKNDVTCSFGKGQDRQAETAVKALTAAGFSPETKTHVHPQTLKAFVRESLEDGRDIDLNLFGAFVTQVATFDTRK